MKRKILVFGGYGGNNVGDDAQLAGSLQLLKKKFPNYTVVVGTPNLSQTFLRHEVEAVALASRNALFDFDLNPRRYTDWRVAENKKWLLDRFKKIEKNLEAYALEKSHTLSKRQIQFIENIKSSSLIFYSGGGYLMGPTASRLWDAACVARIANYFGIPLVFSGQNIGLWGGVENEKYGQILFEKAGLITTRDRTFSIKELEKIGIVRESIYPTCDDALFLDTKKTENKISSFLSQKFNLKSGSFVALSFHDGNFIKSIVPVLQKFISDPILIVPTTPPDVLVQGKLFDELDKNRFMRVDNLLSFSESKEIFSRSKYTISTRHHPLIFSLSGSRPCISLNLSEYFLNKNFGAQELCNIGEFSIDAFSRSPENVKEIIIEKLKSIQGNECLYSKLISESFFRIKESKRRFERDLELILNRSSENEA